jgi:hypothetical protein
MQGCRRVPDTRVTATARRLLPALLLLYAAASLIHFLHNGLYLSAYPNLPPRWTPTQVYAAWLCLTLVGLGGYLLYRQGWRARGLGVLMLYALAGFGGLLHYTRAPLAHHSSAMNGTIWAETGAAALLLAELVFLAMHKLKSQRA